MNPQPMQQSMQQPMPVMAGGAPGLTKQLKQLYDRQALMAQEQGQPAPDWPTWLQSNGFQLSPDGQAQPQSPDAIQKLMDAQREYL